jgi:diguanylate cyclase (GGDEF)-like protein
MIAIVVRLVIAAHESRQIEKARHTQSRTDDLTGLANRRGFYSHLDRQLEAIEATGEPMALLLMDLDHFKEFNDSLGHAAGDRLLQEVAARLPRVLPEDSYVARIGGDEAHEAAVAIGQVLSIPMQLSGISCHTAASIGIALAPEHGDDRTTLLRRADIAMYRAKQRSTGIELFELEHEQLSRDHIKLAGELRHAIDNDELVLHYQPKAQLKDGRVGCVEALVRWQHPSRGLLPPDAFLPFGERYGLMRQITRSVLELALRQQLAWREGGINVMVAVNLSGADLLDPGFPAEVAALLRQYGTPVGQLQFEITENTVMAEPERVLDTLSRLGELGITFALDDYGTGRSSLAYLKRLPVNELKNDR